MVIATILDKHGAALLRGTRKQGIGKYPVVVPGIFVAAGAASSSADHGHSLRSLYPPPAALPSLPTGQFHCYRFESLPARSAEQIKEIPEWVSPLFVCIWTHLIIQRCKINDKDINLFTNLQRTLIRSCYREIIRSISAILFTIIFCISNILSNILR